jgi:hypothetical protein
MFLVKLFFRYHRCLVVRGWKNTGEHNFHYLSHMCKSDGVLCSQRGGTSVEERTALRRQVSTIVIAFLLKSNYHGAQQGE